MGGGGGARNLGTESSDVIKIPPQLHSFHTVMNMYCFFLLLFEQILERPIFFTPRAETALVEFAKMQTVTKWYNCLIFSLGYYG